ncbi:hypothetical protein MHBO_004388, partial [Bonamia ostreae]
MWCLLDWYEIDNIQKCLGNGNLNTFLLHIQQVNLANSDQFPHATVGTNKSFNTPYLRRVIDSDENTCIQLTDGEKWIKVWLAKDANVGVLTVTSKKSGKLD